MRFEFELWNLKMCFNPFDLIYPIFYDLECDSFDVLLCSVEQPPWKIHVFLHNCIILNIHKICAKSNQNYFICLQWMFFSKFYGICFKMLLICTPFVESIIYKWLLISIFLLINMQNFLYLILLPSFNLPSSITHFFLPTSTYKPLFKIFQTLNISNPKTLSFTFFV